MALPFTFIPKRLYMMPVQFGPAAGPRQNQHGERFIYDQPQECCQHVLVYETDLEMLQALMLPGFRVDEPHVIVAHKMHRNLAWLAGHGYNVCTFDIPVTYHGKNETIKGTFLLAIWENHADPIITGREQLGYSKIYAEISDVITHHAVSKTTLSSWGFQFLHLEFDLSGEGESKSELIRILTDPERKSKLHYKYIPHSGEGFSKADVAYVTVTPASKIPDDAEKMQPPVNVYGTGNIRWNIPQWENMPTQYHIVQAMARLPIKRIVGACKCEFKHLGDVFEQRRVM